MREKFHAQKLTGDAQRFDYVPASHLFPRFQESSMKTVWNNPTKKPNVSRQKKPDWIFGKLNSESSPNQVESVRTGR
jgi:hypothetical protein